MRIYLMGFFLIAALANAGLAAEPKCGLLQRKANVMAKLGRCGHITPGRIPGARAEGVGWSTRSESQAIRNCCFYGERKLIGKAVKKGRKGWYAVCQYR